MFSKASLSFGTYPNITLEIVVHFLVKFGHCPDSNQSPGLAHLVFEPSYVSVACKGSMANLILSGFPPQKNTRTPVGIPTQPQGIAVSHGQQLGQLEVKVNPVFGAVIYSFRLTPATPGAVPVIEQGTAATHTFSNLAAGVKYTADVNVSGTAGTSDWSNPASLTAD